MSKTNTITDYDSNADDFDNNRKPSPLLIEELRKRFCTGGRILSVGCGTGQYEAILNESCNVIGLDRSPGMLMIARKRIGTCIIGDMTNMPFHDSEFDGVYFMQSLHHSGANFNISCDERTNARRSALIEAWRVLNKGVLAIVQRDPSQNKAVWFWKYFPEALEKKLIIQPANKQVIKWLEEIGLSRVTAVPIDDPMVKGFYDAEAPLSQSFRKSFSEFSYLTDEEMEKGVSHLKQAIRSGNALRDIEICKKDFRKIGGTVFIISGLKE